MSKKLAIEDVSLSALKGAHGKSGAIFFNSKTNWQFDGRYSFSSFDYNDKTMNLEKAFSTGAKACAHITTSEPSTIVPLKDLEEETKQHCYDNFNKSWPNNAKPDTFEQFCAEYKFVSCLKEHEQYGFSFKVSLVTTSSVRKFKPTVCFAEEEDGTIIAVDLVENFKKGSMVCLKLRPQMVWFMGKSYGIKWNIVSAFVKSHGDDDEDNEEDDPSDFSVPKSKKAKMK